MIDMGVAEDNSMDRRGIKREMTIAFDGFGALSLEKTTFHQNSLLVYFEQVHRPGGGASGAEEMDSHQMRMLAGRQTASFSQIAARPRVLLRSG